MLGFLHLLKLNPIPRVEYVVHEETGELDGAYRRPWRLRYGPRQIELLEELPYGGIESYLRDATMDWKFSLAGGVFTFSAPIGVLFNTPVPRRVLSAR